MAAVGPLGIKRYHSVADPAFPDRVLHLPRNVIEAVVAVCAYLYYILHFEF